MSKFNMGDTVRVINNETHAQDALAMAPEGDEEGQVGEVVAVNTYSHCVSDYDIEVPGREEFIIADDNFLELVI